jgi:hypothetical protein
MILLVVAGIGATLLALALSVAFARPAGASTLPLPSSPTLPAPVAPSALSTVADTMTAAVSPLPSVPLPAPFPVAHPPILHLPVATRAVVHSPTAPVTTPTPTTSGGLLPMTGGPAGVSTDIHSDPPPRQAGSTPDRSSGSSILTTPGPPVRTPTPRVPLPLSPLAPSSAGEASAPGHGSTPSNAVLLTILLLAAIGLGGVVTRRRLSLKLLFDPRFAPPG